MAAVAAGSPSHRAPLACGPARIPAAVGCSSAGRGRSTWDPRLDRPELAANHGAPSVGRTPGPTVWRPQTDHWWDALGDAHRRSLAGGAHRVRRLANGLQPLYALAPRWHLGTHPRLTAPACTYLTAKCNCKKGVFAKLQPEQAGRARDEREIVACALLGAGGATRRHCFTWLISRSTRFRARCWPSSSLPTPAVATACRPEPVGGVVSCLH